MRCRCEGKADLGKSSGKVAGLIRHMRDRCGGEKSGLVKKPGRETERREETAQKNRGNLNDWKTTKTCHERMNKSCKTISDTPKLDRTIRLPQFNSMFSFRHILLVS